MLEFKRLTMEDISKVREYVLSGAGTQREKTDL